MKTNKKYIIFTIFVGLLISVFLVFPITTFIPNSFFAMKTENNDPLETEQALIYGTFNLTERMDSSKSGMIVHDLVIKVDYVEAKDFKKRYTQNPIDKSIYQNLSWRHLKNNILDADDKGNHDDGNYVGLNAVSEKFKIKFLSKKIKISGRIYSYCLNTYYLNPATEKKPKVSISCWGSAASSHIKLSNYYYKKIN